MECRERAFQLMEYARGALRGQELRDLEEHLGSCARCRLELDSWLRLEQALSPFPLVAEPAWLKASIMAGLRPAARRSALHAWGWAGIWLPVAVSALLVPALAALLLLSGNLNAGTLMEWQDQAVMVADAYLATAVPFLAMAAWLMGCGTMIFFIALGTERRHHRMAQL